jgi:hypothetical protein
MKNFYYFVTSLKDLPLQIDEKVKFEYSLSDLINDINLEIPFKYRKSIYDYLLYFDNLNLIDILEGKKKLKYSIGNFSYEEISEIVKEFKSKSEYAILHSFPIYWHDFILNYIDNKRRYPFLLDQDELFLYYYRYIKDTKNKFLKEYLDYDFNLKNLASAINAKKFKLDKNSYIIPINSFSERLIKEQSYESIVKEEFDLLNEELNYLEKLNILDLELKLDYKRLNYLDELTLYEYFSMDKILAYLIKLSIVERWVKIDNEKGIEIFNSVTNNVKEQVKKNDQEVNNGK